MESDVQKEQVFTEKVKDYLNGFVGSKGIDVSESIRIVTVAKAMALSSRTLQRRLASEGVFFTDILLAIRKAKAEELIKSGISITNIAKRLGYSDHTALAVFFRHNFGMGPSVYREYLRNHGGLQ
jgi:AraC-like DNA-binding protein